MTERVINWRSRIVKSGKIRASEIKPHPANPRRHPEAQQEVIAGSFDEIGQIAPIIINVNNDYLVDGEDRSHLALAQRGDVEVDAIWVNLTEDEHLKALAYLDASTGLAQYDAEMWISLVDSFETENAAIEDMLDAYREDAEIEALLAEANGGSPSAPRNLGEKSKTVMCVLYMPQLSIFEQALAATGLVNRGEAMAEICRNYLEQKGQFDFPAEDDLEASGAEAASRPRRPRNPRRLR